MFGRILTITYTVHGHGCGWPAPSQCLQEDILSIRVHDWEQDGDCIVCNTADTEHRKMLLILNTACCQVRTWVQNMLDGSLYKPIEAPPGYRPANITDMVSQENHLTRTQHTRIRVK